MKNKESYKKLCGRFFDFPVCKYRDDLFNAYEQMLVDISECEDEDGIFSWWLYESSKDNKVITVRENGKQVDFDVTTAEGLYNYLCTYYGETKEVL